MSTRAIQIRDKLIELWGNLEDIQVSTKGEIPNEDYLFNLPGQPSAHTSKIFVDYRTGETAGNVRYPKCTYEIRFAVRDVEDPEARLDLILVKACQALENDPTLGLGFVVDSKPVRHTTKLFNFDNRTGGLLELEIEFKDNFLDV